MKVSIVIPVYNVSDYIERCISSVIAQTYDNIECIIVDDCTPDDSIEKCQRMIAEYNGQIEFKILHHERNRGLSAARNTGTFYATGEFLYYLDSDDWIIPKCIELLVECAMKYPESEIVVGGAETTNGSFSYMNYEEKKYLPEYSDDVNWINYAFLKHELLSMTAWNKLIRRTFVIKNQLFFVEGIFNEDEVWHYMLSKYVSHLSILHKNTYVYVIRDNSIITGKERTYSERNWIIILNIWLANCGGKFRKREISAIFYHVYIRYANSEDSYLKEKLRQVLRNALRKASLRQKIGICVFLLAPASQLVNPKFSKFVYFLVGRL